MRVCVHIGTYVYEIAYTCIDIFRMILGKKLVAAVATGKENWVAGVGVEEDFSLYTFYPFSLCIMFIYSWFKKITNI